MQLAGDSDDPERTVRSGRRLLEPAAFLCSPNPEDPHPGSQPRGPPRAYLGCRCGAATAAAAAGTTAATVAARGPCPPAALAAPWLGPGWRQFCGPRGLLPEFRESAADEWVLPRPPHVTFPARTKILPTSSAGRGQRPVPGAALGWMTQWPSLCTWLFPLLRPVFLFLLRVLGVGGG